MSSKKEQRKQRREARREGLEQSGFGKLLDKAKKFAPQVAKQVFDVAMGESPIKAVGDLIQGLRGVEEDPESRLAPEDHLELQKLIMDLERDRDKFTLEMTRVEADFRKAILVDKQDARENYDKTQNVANRLAFIVMRWNLFGIAVCVCLIIGSVKWFGDDPSLLAVITSVIGGVITLLGQERLQVMGFYFGSSLGSKLKTWFKGPEEEKDETSLL